MNFRILHISYEDDRLSEVLLPRDTIQGTHPCSCPHSPRWHPQGIGFRYWNRPLVTKSKAQTPQNHRVLWDEMRHMFEPSVLLYREGLDHIIDAMSTGDSAISSTTTPSSDRKSPPRLHWQGPPVNRRNYSRLNFWRNTSALLFSKA